MKKLTVVLLLLALTGCAIPYGSGAAGYEHECCGADFFKERAVCAAWWTVATPIMVYQMIFG